MCVIIYIRRIREENIGFALCLIQANIAADISIAPSEVVCLTLWDGSVAVTLMK